MVCFATCYATTCRWCSCGELYASAAWAGALTLIGLQALDVTPVVAAWSGMVVVLVLRFLAMAFRITLPTYTERK